MGARFFLTITAILFCSLSTSVTVAGPKNGGARISVETLAWPDGAVASRANAINPSGTIAVGDAYWNATFESRNNWYAARWTRTGTDAAWVAEDLRPLLPATTWSWALHVNDAGMLTVVYEVPGPPSRYRSVLLTDTTVADLGLDVYVNALSENGAVAGLRYDPTYVAPDVAMYWPYPSAAAVTLPPLEDGYGAAAAWLVGNDIYGTAGDANGAWLVRWDSGLLTARPVRLLQMPPRFGVSAMNGNGLLAGSRCTTPCPWAARRAVSWAAPYAGEPAYLPTLYGPYSWTTAVTESGTIVGVVENNNGGSMIPVIWPSNTTVQALPIPSRGKTGMTSSVSGPRVAGFVDTRSGTFAAIWTLP